MKTRALALTILLVPMVAGCSETTKEFIRQVAPVIACQKAEREYFDWIAKGRPVNTDKPNTAAALRGGIEFAYKETREWCARRGIVIR